jgi:hypothetical protein
MPYSIRGTCVYGGWRESILFLCLTLYNGCGLGFALFVVLMGGAKLAPLLPGLLYLALVAAWSILVKLAAKAMSQAQFGYVCW